MVELDSGYNLSLQEILKLDVRSRVREGSRLPAGEQQEELTVKTVVIAPADG